MTPRAFDHAETTDGDMVAQRHALAAERVDLDIILQGDAAAQTQAAGVEQLHPSPHKQRALATAQGGPRAAGRGHRPGPAPSAR